MSNMDLYNKVRSVPQEALKEIAAGRLKGKSDINPMWRIRALTEHFGMCGVGWKYVITRQWLEQGANEEQSAFVNIDLFVKVDGQWSDAIPGTGGSAFVAREKSGPYTSDECFKMALTDAISVACKALGFGADVYWSTDKTKERQQPPQVELVGETEVKAMRDVLGMSSYTEKDFCKDAKIAKIEDLPMSRYEGAFRHINSKVGKLLEEAA